MLGDRFLPGRYEGDLFDRVRVGGLCLLGVGALRLDPSGGCLGTVSGLLEKLFGFLIC